MYQIITISRGAVFIVKLSVNYHATITCFHNYIYSPFDFLLNYSQFTSIHNITIDNFCHLQLI